MRKFKFTVWFFLVFIFQTVLAGYFSIRSVSPDLVIVFMVCVMVLEDSFASAMAAGILCGVLTGALCGKNFSFSVLFYTYTSLIIFKLRRYPVYVHDLLKIIVYTAVASAAMEALSYLVLYRSVSWIFSAFFVKMLPNVLYNTALSPLVYLVIKRSLFKTEVKKKILIG